MRNAFEDLDKIKKVLVSCTDFNMLNNSFTWACGYINRNYPVGGRSYGTFGLEHELYHQRVRRIYNEKKLQLKDV